MKLTNEDLKQNSLFFTRSENYLDGGTVILQFIYNNERDIAFFIDKRIGTETPNTLWLGRPGKEGAFQVDEEVKQKIYKQFETFTKQMNGNLKALNNAVVA